MSGSDIGAYEGGGKRKREREPVGHSCAEQACAGEKKEMVGGAESREREKKGQMARRASGSVFSLSLSLSRGNNSGERGRVRRRLFGFSHTLSLDTTKIRRREDDV